MTNKQQLRQQLLHLRQEQHSLLQVPMLQALHEEISKLLPSPPLVVSGYSAFDDEVNLTPLLHTLHAMSYTIALPVVVAPKTPLTFRLWTPDTLLEQGIWNIPVPPLSAPELLPDVVLTPLLAFDRQGNRLGFGGGFYDRTLHQLRQHKATLAIGVAFSFQEVTQVPTQPTDEILDWIITEKECIKTGIG